MEPTPSQKKTIRHQFDSFCRKILRDETRDYFRELTRHLSKEINFSELSEEQLDMLSTEDAYPSDFNYFKVQGYSVTIHDDRLASVLSALTDEKRDIVLLSYFLDMTDQEIADKLNMVRYTVQRRRVSSLAEMKRRLEVIDDGKCSD